MWLVLQHHDYKEELKADFQASRKSLLCAYNGLFWEGGWNINETYFFLLQFSGKAKPEQEIRIWSMWAGMLREHGGWLFPGGVGYSVSQMQGAACVCSMGSKCFSLTSVLTMKWIEDALCALHIDSISRKHKKEVQATNEDLHLWWKFAEQGES